MAQPSHAWLEHRRQRFVEDATTVQTELRTALKLLERLPLPTDPNDDVLFAMTRAAAYAKSVLGAIRTVDGHPKSSKR